MLDLIYNILFRVIGALVAVIIVLVLVAAMIPIAPFALCMLCFKMARSFYRHTRQLERSNSLACDSTPYSTMPLPKIVRKKAPMKPVCGEGSPNSIELP